MRKWEKATFWIILATIGILFIGYLLGADLRGLIGTVVIIDILIILETATDNFKSKWKAFWIIILIMFFVTLILGLIFGVSEEGSAKLFSVILLLELIQTLSKKKENTPKKNK